jgi:tetratricopeptide (TPR) repeat protein
LTIFVFLATVLAPGTTRADLGDDLAKTLNDANKEFRENRPDEASKHLGHALKLIETFKSTDRPNDKDYLQEAYLRLRYNPPQIDPALDAIKNALVRDSKSPEALFLRGYVHTKYMANAQYAGLEDLKAALKRRKEVTNPVSPMWASDAANEMWQVFEQLKRHDLAAAEFQSLANQEPEDVDYRFFLGVAQLRLKNYEAAAEALAKGLEHRPSDWQFHIYYTAALKELGDPKAAIQRYEEFLNKKELLKTPEDEFTVQMALAMLYLEGNQSEPARKLMRAAKKSPALLDPNSHSKLYIRSIRVELAKGFAKLDEHSEAAAQYAQILASLPANTDPGRKIDLTIDYAKALVRADRLTEGIRKLKDALASARFNSTSELEQEPLDILFELGAAHWKLAKKEKTKADEAEIYFRKYLQELRRGTVRARRYSSDVEIAESLGKLYADADDHANAAVYFREALDLIAVAVDKEKCPTNRVQFEYLEALAGSKQWDKCILAAKELLRDKEYGLKSRRILAQAYLESDQWNKAIEQLNELKGTKEWNDDAVLFMGQALLKTDRADEALSYIEEAYKARPNDERRILEYAEVLRVLGRADEARSLYEKTIKADPRTAQAHVGLGDLELQLAKAASGTERVNSIEQAVGYFKAAKKLTPSTLVLEKLSQAERDLAVAQSEVQIQASRWQAALYTGGLILAACLPIGVMIYYYRRQWAMRCFQDVCRLESDLIQLIRDRVKTRFQGEWGRFGDEPFKGRLDFKSLQNRANAQGAKDILAVANFGHLVAIIDNGWEALGFNELCAAEMVDPKEVIIANLSYVSSCRVCLAHVGRLEELGSRHLRRHAQTEAGLKAHLSNHLHRQVKTSLQIIRAKFNVTPGTEGELPVLTSTRNV